MAAGTTRSLIGVALSALGAAVFLCVISIPYVHAQLVNTSMQAGLTVDPATPPPYSTVTVSLDAYSLNTNGASVTWYQDGTELTNDTNARSIQVQVGGVGEKTSIEAVMTPPGGSPLTFTHVISPGDVDLIVESDSYVPGFYKGRALPSAGSLIRVTAIPNVTGDPDPNTLTYTWSLDGSVLLGGPVKGKRAITLTMPKSPTDLELTLQDRNGVTVGDKTITLTPATVDVKFYEVNPLRGLSRTVVPSTLPIVGDETTVRAVPYYANPASFNDPRAITWTMDNKTTPNTNTDPLLITLRKTGGDGTARIGFSYVDPISLMYSLTRSFSVYFEAAANTFTQ